MSDVDVATMIWDAWCAGRKLDALPEAIRPKDRAEAYAAQKGLLRASRQQSVGWKIAATSLAARSTSMFQGRWPAGCSRRGCCPTEWQACSPTTS